MTKISEFRNKGVTELKKDLDSLLREQFRLRLLKDSGELKEVSKVKQIRRDIARILMLLGSSVEGK